jgi:F-type H+-transporting ATPase subunit delta
MKSNRRTRRDAKQLFRLCLSDGLLDANRVRDVVRRISQSGYRERLGVLWLFRRLVALYTARHTASVQSAVPLHPDLQADVEARLSKLYGPGLSISFAHDRGLLGGMRIKVANDVYDGSVRGRLNALNARF